MNQMPPSNKNLADAALVNAGAPPPTGRPKRQLSYTQLNMFLRCPCSGE